MLFVNHLTNSITSDCNENISPWFIESKIHYIEVKPVYVATFFLSCHGNFHMNWTSFKVALEGNFVCLDYQSLKDYFSKTTKWKLNILVSMCFWKITLYCKLNFIFQNQFNQKLCNIMCKKLGYVLWLKIACPGQITHQIFLFPLQDLTTAYKTVSRIIVCF